TESTLSYTAKFPEFDKNNAPTDVMKDYNGSQNLSTTPELSRLMVPDLKQLKGFWAEEPISILFGLEIIPGTGSSYKVGKYVTRREFVAMLVRAVKDIPRDPNVTTSKTTTTVKKTSSKTPEVSPFKDVKTTDIYYNEIKKAYTSGIIKGDGRSNFNPNAYITQAEAIKMLVSALGLENLAPSPNSTTPFADNDKIPSYYRNAASVAATLGLVEPDARGNFNPATSISNEKAADLLYRFIGYMGDDLVQDYRDRIMTF
ncbi:MAG: S-layer homology domain-containing protein, partial [Clostridia bacterium]|nr:S-layer homology domain-containing protein [Clostridia bacterium]